MASIGTALALRVYANTGHQSYLAGWGQKKTPGPTLREIDLVGPGACGESLSKQATKVWKLWDPVTIMN